MADNATFIKEVLHKRTTNSGITDDVIADNIEQGELGMNLSVEKSRLYIKREDDSIAEFYDNAYYEETEKAIATALNDLNSRIGDVDLTDIENEISTLAETVDENEEVAATALNDLNIRLEEKQDKLIAGDNIVISGNVISSTADVSGIQSQIDSLSGRVNTVSSTTNTHTSQISTISASTRANTSAITELSASTISNERVTATALANLDERIIDMAATIAGKQDALTAGDGITIENNVISVDAEAFEETGVDINYAGAATGYISSLSTGGTKGHTITATRTAMPTIPTVGDGQLTIEVDGVRNTFTANQTGNTSVSINTDGTTQAGHYTPTATASTVGTDGKYVSKIALDAKKHVISVETGTLPTIPSLTATTTGTGNVITGITANGHAITAQKGNIDNVSHATNADSATTATSAATATSATTANRVANNLTVNVKNGDGTTASTTYNGSSAATVNVSSLTVSVVDEFTTGQTDPGTIYAVTGTSREGVYRLDPNQWVGAGSIVLESGVPIEKEVLYSTPFSDFTLYFNSGLKDGESLHMVLIGNTSSEQIYCHVPTVQDNRNTGKRGNGYIKCVINDKDIASGTTKYIVLPNRVPVEINVLCIYNTLAESGNYPTYFINTNGTVLESLA